MGGSQLDPEEGARAAARIAADPAFSALDASGAPILAASGDPLAIVHLNAAARAVFGDDAAALADRLFRGEEPGAKRLAELVESVRHGAALRLERLSLLISDRAQTVTILCRRLLGEDGAASIVLATLGVHAPAPSVVEPTAEDAPSDATIALRARLAARHGARAPRFLWKTDAQGRFTDVSHTLADVVGESGADILGRSVEEAAWALSLGPALALAAAARRSWSGLEVAWPLEGGAGRAPVTLGALPVLDAARQFAGFQGYGVLHLDRAVAPEGATPVEASVKAPAREAPRERRVGDNIVVLRPRAEPEGEAALSSTELSAFDEIARTLRDGGPIGAEAEEEAASPDYSSQALLAALDRLPVGVLVARGEETLYANRALLDDLGYADRAGFDAAGGFTRMFFGRTPGQPGSGAGAAQIDASGLDAHVQIVDWDGGPATLVALRRHRPRRDGEHDPEAARLAAEAANAAKSDFLARVSHEIRTPLNAIIGFAEVMMEERLGPIGSPRYKEYLKDIHASGRHVLSLVNDLLDLSKIEAGKMELSFERVDANAIIAECVSIMQAQANQAKIVMRLALAPTLPPIRADARALKQILLNLLSNAVKFNEPGGQVIVSSALTEAGAVVIRVKDTGIGMSEDEIEMALEPFKQIATSRETSGTGLGLPLTKALIEANHAAFRIQSRKNEGTLVEIAFPPPQVLAAE